MESTDQEININSRIVDMPDHARSDKENTRIALFRIAIKNVAKKFYHTSKENLHLSIYAILWLSFIITTHSIHEYIILFNGASSHASNIHYQAHIPYINALANAIAFLFIYLTLSGNHKNAETATETFLMNFITLLFASINL
ncbi:hypothetical protein NEFER03_1446 [Nematocida sp. LUAm3]|nr:hypothetical protein NEFER03_1446 [Nematocida sp. LUAm3]KAI5174724.1 hypothetical protein NEFER02_0834 [Nematocida sp. LUAm2]KAI5177865.1 hypothetical protein NEFER01_1067 [Nematocida sp. LUAm1]